MKNDSHEFNARSGRSGMDDFEARLRGQQQHQYSQPRIDPSTSRSFVPIDPVPVTVNRMDVPIDPSGGAAPQSYAKDLIGTRSFGK